MLNRRELLHGIGAIIGVGVVGKVTASQAAPVELPVVQAPQTKSIGEVDFVAYSDNRPFSLSSAQISFDGENWQDILPFITNLDLQHGSFRRIDGGEG